MQSNPQRLLQSTRSPLVDQAGGGIRNITNPPIEPVFDENVVDPRKFIIFDRTDNRSHIMYHREMTRNFGHPGACYIETNIVVRNDKNTPEEVQSVMKEDSADIDLFLSSEEEEYEDEEVSTARTTHENDVGDTADSCCLKPRKTMLGLSSFSHKSIGSCEQKRDKIRKMVSSLRAIMPGGNRMNTIAVIDEAVKYLNTLKVELQKVGVENLKN